MSATTSKSLRIVIDFVNHLSPWLSFVCRLQCSEGLTTSMQKPRIFID